MLRTEDYLIETADRCIRLAKTGRRLADELEAVTGEDDKAFRQLAATGRAVASELEAMSHDLMATAVEIETERQRASPGAFGP